MNNLGIYYIYSCILIFCLFLIQYIFCCTLYSDILCYKLQNVHNNLKKMTVMCQFWGFRNCSIVEEYEIVKELYTRGISYRPLQGVHPDYHKIKRTPQYSEHRFGHVTLSQHPLRFTCVELAYS